MKTENTLVLSQEIGTIAKGAGIAFLGIVTGSGLRYVFQIVIAKNLGVELFGLFFLGFAIFKVLSIISELGLPNGIIRYVSIYRGVNDTERTKGIIVLSLKSALVAGATVGIILFVLSGVFSIHFLDKRELVSVLKFFAVILPFSTVTTILVFSTQGFKIIKYKMYVREFLEPLFRIIFVVFVFSLGMKLQGVLSAYLCVAVLSIIIAYYYLKKIFPEIADKNVPSIYETKRLFGFSWPLLFVNFIGNLLLWTDTLMLGLFMAPAEIGIYGVAQRTALLCCVFVTSFNSIFAPIIADLYSRKNMNDLEKLYKTVTKWIFSITLPLSLLIIFFAEPILTLFGSDFVAGTKCLILLSIGWLIHSSTGPVGQVISMTGRSKLNLLNATGVLVLNIVLNLILIPKYGILGAAAATALSLNLANIIAVLEVYFILRMHPYRLDFIKPLIAGGLSSIVLLLYKMYTISTHHELLIYIRIFAFLAVYGIVLILFKIEKEDKLVLDKIRTKLLPRG